MNGYSGDSAKKFVQTRGKTYLLNPSIARHTPRAKTDGEKFLEVGCGNAFFCGLARRRGYDYFGLDVSGEMLDRAKKENPKGHYLLSDSTCFSKKYHEKFSVILASQLFPAFSNKNDITKTLLEVKKVLKPGGTVLIGVSHPNFDRYMEKGLFGNTTVETKFTGYFDSGKKMLIKHSFNGEDYIFEDYHWPLETYTKCLREAGLTIKEIDECKPDISARKFNPKFYVERSRYPTYILFICG